ncbi:MAG TPA: ATP-binding protein [Bryobacteraceae bacterium]|nr:ATP-binding protein [Bryobacteraceae bacterium]
MLLEFTIGNFKSFREKATLSLEAANDDTLEETNLSSALDSGLRLVKGAGIYGANASGKSNLIEAMTLFRHLIQNSSKESQLGQPIPVKPFRLNSESAKAPTFFEVIFLKNRVRYRYGFEATQEAVISEWLFSQHGSIRETCLFTREAGTIRPRPGFKEGNGLQERTRPNALFLSVVAQFNGPLAGAVVNFTDEFRTISGTLEPQYMAYTAGLLNGEHYGRAIRELLRLADTGIADLVPEEIDKEHFLQSLPKELPSQLRDLLALAPSTPTVLKTVHQCFDSKGHRAGTVEFDMMSEESAGTRQFLAFAGPFLHTLHEGAVLAVDELDASLHPLLTKQLVGLFNSSANRRSAQLIFATHDLALLNPKRLRRDQIWFVEKDELGASTLFSLDEIKGVRKDANFEKEYLLGQFGGVPRVGDFQKAVL